MSNDNLIKVFEYALNQENTGKSFFETSIARMGVGAAVSAFKKLVKEEEKHIQFISSVLENLKHGGGVDASMVEKVTLEPTNYFNERAESEFLEQCMEGSMVPDVTVFNVAWLIEKDLAEFYANAARQTEGPVKDSFRMLSAWEEHHERFFKAYRDKLTQTYAEMPWGG